MMGTFPPGSNYPGTTVCPLMASYEFLTNALFPNVHPHAINPQIVDEKSLPSLAQKYHQRLASIAMPGAFGHDAASISYIYTEVRRKYREQSFTVIENLGPMAGDMWSNKDSFYFRAPEGQLDKWRC